MYSGGYDEEISDDAIEDNYPPWMTTTKPSIVKIDDISMDDPVSTSKSLTPKTTETGGASSFSSNVPWSTIRALLYYAVPLAARWLGNLFAAPSPSW